MTEHQRPQSCRDCNRYCTNCITEHDRYCDNTNPLITKKLKACRFPANLKQFAWMVVCMLRRFIHVKLYTQSSQSLMHIAEDLFWHTQATQICNNFIAIAIVINYCMISWQRLKLPTSRLFAHPFGQAQIKQDCFLQKEARVCVSNAFVIEDSKFKWCFLLWKLSKWQRKQIC